MVWRIVVFGCLVFVVGLATQACFGSCVFVLCFRCVGVFGRDFGCVGLD